MLQRILKILWNMLHMLKMLRMLWNTLNLLTIDLLQKAEAELAYELQAAKTKQRIKEENMQIKVIERSQEIAIQTQEIERREKELDSSVRKPAEAEKFKLEKMAEAHK